MSYDLKILYIDILKHGARINSVKKYDNIYTVKITDWKWPYWMKYTTLRPKVGIPED